MRLAIVAIAMVAVASVSAAPIPQMERRTSELDGSLEGDVSLETRDPKGLKFSFFGKGKTGPTDYDNLIRNEDTATLGGTRLQRGWRWVKDNPWKTSLMVAVPVAAGLTTGGLVIGAKEGLFGVHERKTVQEWNVQEEKLDVLSRMEKQGMTKLPQPSTL